MHIDSGCNFELGCRFLVRIRCERGFLLFGLCYVPVDNILIALLKSFWSND